jgi:hypothetical protein
LFSFASCLTAARIEIAHEISDFAIDAPQDVPIANSFDIHGVVKEIREVQDEDTAKKQKGGNRRWWIVEFEKPRASLLIKKWNGEVDVHENKRWFHKVNRRNHPTTDATKLGLSNYYFQHARYKVSNWKTLNSAQPGENMTLQMSFVASGHIGGKSMSCWRTGKLAMKRGTKGWFGLLRESNLNLDSGELGVDEPDNFEDEDEDEAALAIQHVGGAKVLQAVIDLWTLMRQLENLHANWEVEGDARSVQDALSSVDSAVQRAILSCDLIEDEKLRKNIRGTIESWKKSRTQAGVRDALLEEVRKEPVPGVAVLLTSGMEARVIGMSEAEVELKEGDREMSLMVARHNWQKLVRGLSDKGKQVCLNQGCETYRYGRAWHLTSEPTTVSEVPIEGSKWAMVQPVDENVNATWGVVDSACTGHPLVGKLFVARESTYKIVKVEVLREKTKRILVTAELHHSDVVDADSSALSVYTAKQWKTLATKGNIRLDAPVENKRGSNSRGQLVVTGVDIKRHRFAVRIEGMLKPASVILLNAERRLHRNVVARRTSWLLEIALTHAWATPNYGRDDFQKAGKKARDITARIFVGMLLAGVFVAQVSITFGGLPAFILFAIPAMMVTQLTSVGIPSHTAHRIGDGYAASLLAFDELHHAEELAAAKVASELCPLGSGLTEDDFFRLHAETDTYYEGQFPRDDMHAMCTRHELSEADRKKMHQEKVERLQLQGVHQNLFQRRFKKWEREGRRFGIFTRGTLEDKALYRYGASVFMMNRLAQSIATISELGCEVVPDLDAPQNYRLRERDILTE